MSTTSVNESDSNQEDVDGEAVDDVAEDYEPYDHREEEGKVLSSSFMAWSNLVKSSVGTGVFAMPEAFGFVGLINAIVGTFFLGLVMISTFHMLVGAHHRMCKLERKPTLSYSEVIQAAVKTGPEKIQRYASRARCCVDAMIIACFLGISSVYVVFVSGILVALVRTNPSWNQPLYSIALFPFLVALNFVRNLKLFAILSTIGNVLTILAICFGIYAVFQEDNAKNYVNFADTYSLYPRFIGAVFFGLGSPGLVLSIENSMRNPSRMRGIFGVLNFGMIPVIALHVFVGVVGYLRWTTDACANFLINLPYNGITLTALMMQATSIYVSYGLQCYMPIKILYENYALPSMENRDHCWKSSIGWDLIIRVGSTLLTCILAAVIPKLGLFIGLVGALCIASLGVLIPVMLYLLVHHDDLGKWKWRLCLGVCWLILGVTAIVCVANTSVFLIIGYFLGEDKEKEMSEC